MSHVCDVLHTYAVHQTGTSAFIDANKRALIVVDVQVRFWLRSDVYARCSWWCGWAHYCLVFCVSHHHTCTPTHVQNDFCEGGPLEVPEGSAVVPVINRLREECKWDLVVFTQDYHPAGMCRMVLVLGCFAPACGV